MAKYTIEEVVDDIDGTPGAESFTFAVNGLHYEIDLAGANADEFRSDMDKWAERARLSRPAGRPSRPDPGSVRRWWKVNAALVEEKTGKGYRRSGIIPGKVFELYAEYVRDRAGASAG